MYTYKYLSEYNRELNRVGLDDWVRASLKLKLYWGIPGLQWSRLIKSGPWKMAGR